MKVRILIMSKPFELGMVVDAVPLEQICPGWEYYEVPTALQMLPFHSEEKWQEVKTWLLAANKKLPVSSHYIQGYGLSACGPEFDHAQQVFWADRAFRRMNEIGVEVVGVYGGFFKCPENYSKSKAVDQALSFCNILADQAEKYNMLIALEPMANLSTLFPRYLDGLEFAKSTGRKSVKVMADLNYFIRLDQPVEHIEKDPEACLHVHIAGEKAQPNVGIREDLFVRLFEVLKEVGYTRGVSAACPWKSTKGGDTIDYLYETKVTLEYLQRLRDKVYGV
jgi:sugar phosphate isomerase/epimerase